MKITREEIPKIENVDRIILLLRTADAQFEKNNLEGYLSAVLIYHQVLEEYLVNLIMLSSFLIKKKIHPIEIDYNRPEKLMFGEILKEHKRTISFPHKKEITDLSNEFNKVRIEFVHNIVKYNSEELPNNAVNLKRKFYEITDLYWEARDFIEENLLKEDNLDS